MAAGRIASSDSFSDIPTVITSNYMQKIKLLIQLTVKDRH